MITLFVSAMMTIIDYINVFTKGKLSVMMRGNRFHQYWVASFLGATPGCLGAFMNVTLYVRGLISFGAIVGGMIATSGDEAFVMLTLFPRIALLLFAILFVLGIVFIWISDRIVPLVKIVPCKECRFAVFHADNKECRCFALKFGRDSQKFYC
jgi:hypothetical protein